MLRNYVIAAFIIVFLSIPFAMWIGCGSTETTVTGDDDDDNDDTGQVDDDDDDSNEDNEPPPPPTVDDPRSPTSLDFQSITGVTEPGAFVEILGGAENASTYADVVSGEFCVVVNLILNTNNILSITASDQAGNESDPTNIEIEQVRNNACLNGQADAASVSYSEPNDTPDKAIDGNRNTYWANTSQPWQTESLRTPQWFRVELQQLETINRIDTYWTDEAYATEYEIYISTAEEEPVKPHNDENWADEYTLIASQTNPTSGFNQHNDFDLSDDPVEARWILVVLYESIKKNVFLYKYELQELEAYTLQSGETDPGCE